MSLLYPLFLAAIAAIGLPILLHLIRRSTRNRVTFSSLLFVRTTVPRLKNRSRLENLTLLVLRCLVVCLLALAFARPFFAAAPAQDQAHPGKRIVLSLDTSASMRRDGAWTRAIAEARSVLQEAAPADRVCVMTFDQEIRTLVGFESWAAMDPARRAPVAAEELSRLSPGWATTHLGQALVAAAEAIEDDDTDADQTPARVRQIVLISDMQRGSRLDALAAYEWPKEIGLVIRPIRCQGTSNAAMQRVITGDPLARPGDDEPPRVRVTNSSDATAEQFQIHWGNPTRAGTSGKAVEVYVPPGSSAVVRAPARAEAASPDRLVLTGDDQDFDNTLYMATNVQAQVRILYLGPDDPNDSKAMLYYLRLAFSSAGPTSGGPVEPNSPRPAGLAEARVVWLSGTQALSAAEAEAASLIIAGGDMDPGSLAEVGRFLALGRTVLVAMRSAGEAATVAALAGISGLDSAEASIHPQGGRGYAMLGRMEFNHPLLVAFRDPRFGDFTRIHFWRHRRIAPADCPGARVLAWFDSNDPALLEIPVGRGTLLVLTSGWHPEDSDLSLSSKFVPLLYSILEYGGVLAGQPSQYSVGDLVPMPHWAAVGSANASVVRRPDGTVVSLAARQEAFAQTDLPGIYTVESSAGARTFAVNLAAEESRTEPLPLEDIEALGVSLKASPVVALEVAQRTSQQGSPVEVEQRQKLWRWLLVAASAVLLVETWMAGRTSSHQVGSPADQTAIPEE